MKDEALKLALEALENWQEFDPENFGVTDNRAITAIKQALEAPVQEPVAWQWKMSNATDHWQVSDKPHPDALHKRPLYTTPLAAQRQWFGLTDEEIAKIYMDNTDHPLMVNWVYTRAIEQALKEKNT